MLQLGHATFQSIQAPDSAGGYRIAASRYRGGNELAPFRQARACQIGSSVCAFGHSVAHTAHSPNGLSGNPYITQAAIRALAHRPVCRMTGPTQEAACWGSARIRRRCEVAGRWGFGSFSIEAVIKPLIQQA